MKFHGKYIVLNITSKFYMLLENKPQQGKILHDHKFEFQRWFLKFNEYLRGIFITLPNIYDGAF